MHKPPLPTRSLGIARKLRRSPTDAEHVLWKHLRNGQLDGLKFRRQYAVPPYVVDFYCHSLRLVVEVDGSQHNEQVDAVRSRYLQSQGLKLLRFWAHDVLRHTDCVIEAIFNVASNRTLTPTPLPTGEGLKSEKP